MLKLPKHEIAYAAAEDAAERQRRAEGRRHWNQDDYDAAVAEYHRLNPCPADVECELCRPAKKSPGRLTFSRIVLCLIRFKRHTQHAEQQP